MQIISSLITILLLFVFLPFNAQAEEEKIPIFVSILPQAFFVEEIGGDRVAVDVLVQPGQSPATYAPTPKQMAKLSSSRIFFRIGVAFENVFIPKIEQSIPEILIVDTREGIHLEKGENHAHEGSQHHDNELDPHIWLDPLLVKKQASIITDTLAAIDPAGASLYEKNFSAFADKLDALDQQLRQELAPIKGKSFFVFHPAFGYFARAYGLKQIAVETGGKNPSGRHLANLIESAMEMDVKVLFVQPQFSRKSAETIARAIDGEVIAIDPLARDYFTNMRRMAQAMKQALQ